jgi:alkanesulfonate monooxygenase SsuD/methylene tetrahydromethanopterin reductase-like flavin-dependent oxidoreductase (luciferase family)
VSGPDTAPAGPSGTPRVPTAKGLPAPDDRPRLALGRMGIWTPALDTVPSARARDLVAELEDLGYGAIWVPEVAGRDPFVSLALVLAGTRSIVGATGIASIWARDPIAMSCAAASLTEAYPERILVGRNAW